MAKESTWWWRKRICLSCQKYTTDRGKRKCTGSRKDWELYGVIFRSMYRRRVHIYLRRNREGHDFGCKNESNVRFYVVTLDVFALFWGVYTPNNQARLAYGSCSLWRQRTAAEEQAVLSRRSNELYRLLLSFSSYLLSFFFPNPLVSSSVFPSLVSLCIQWVPTFQT